MSKLIGLDIGHGTDTAGKRVTHSGTVYKEHTFNSAVGIEADKMLQYNGFRTLLMQKPNSKEFPLMERITAYNQNKVDLVFSIHADANNSATAKGRYIFYWHNSVGGKKIALIYVDEIKKAGYSTRGNGTQSSQIGDWTNLAICRATNMVGVLAENGFYTNTDDFKLIFQSPKYITDIARVITKSICRYYGITYKEINEIPKTDTGSLYKVQVGAFASKENADKLVVELEKKGYKPFIKKE